MSKPQGRAASVAAVTTGYSYQARWFWIHALRMLYLHPKVVRVRFEDSEDPYFDDVVAVMTDGYQHGLLRVSQQCSQLKFHVHQELALGWDVLLDALTYGPKSSRSFVQRVLASHDRYQTGTYSLVTSYGLDGNDRLRSMIRGHNHHLDLTTLSDAGGRSDLGKLRERIRAASPGRSWDDVRAALSRARIVSGRSLDDLNANLSDGLSAIGMAGVEGSLATLYDEFPYAYLREEAIDWDRDTLVGILRKHFDYEPKEQSENYRIAIRQFESFADYLDENADEVLDLRDVFEGRSLSAGSWDDVAQRVRPFIASASAARNDLEVHLACVGSIALVAGLSVAAKANPRLSVAQSGRFGRQVWHLYGQPPQDAATFNIHEVVLHEGAPELVIAVSATHNIVNYVQEFAMEHMPAAGHLISFELEPVGSQSIKDGAHALALAEQVAAYLHRSPTLARAPLHFFSAAPNALVFALGTALKRSPRVTTYEFPFEDRTSTHYEPTMTVTL